jgi:hypothetical protein
VEVYAAHPTQVPAAAAEGFDQGVERDAEPGMRAAWVVAFVFDEVDLEVSLDDWNVGQEEPQGPVQDEPGGGEYQY